MKTSEVANLVIARDTVSHAEKLLSAIGCFIAILTVSWSSHYFVGGMSLTLMVASMGASAILVFAVPHSPFSLPWSLVGGQVISALVGITCLKLIPDPLIALAVAVSGATFAMHFLRCLHPPGGATAAAAVLGGDQMLQLGYHFALTPVGLNAVVMLGIGLLLNNLLPGRHYPAGLKQLQAQPKANPGRPTLSDEDLEAALKQMNTLIDVDQQDLARIYALAAEHAEGANLDSTAIRLGHFYSNGEYGENWSVRQIVDQPATHGTPKPGDRITYRVIAGKDRRARGHTTREEFANWAKYEVFRNETCWHRTDQAHQAVAAET
jgi:CBS domain-containing membrane protein